MLNYIIFNCEDNVDDTETIDNEDKLLKRLNVESIGPKGIAA